MRRTPRSPSFSPTTLTAAALLLAAACSNGGNTPEGSRQPGQTDFTTADPSGQSGARTRVPGLSTGGATDQTAVPVVPGAPGGRTATVQEADIYRIDHNRLF